MARLMFKVKCQEEKEKESALHCASQKNVIGEGP